MSIQGIILGAGGEGMPGMRAETGPRSLIQDASGRRVLDWILAMFERASIQPITFVGGYRIEDIGDRYPSLEYIYNPDWQVAGVMSSLYHARHLLCRDTLISYGDVVYRAEVADLLLAEAGEGISIAVDRSSPWVGQGGDEVRKNRVIVLPDGQVADIGFLPGSSGANAEFVGLMFLPAAAASWTKELLDQQYIRRSGQGFEQSDDIRQAFLTDLILYAKRQGIPVRAVDIGRRWAEMDQPDSLPRFVMGTKGETLDRLSSIVRGGRFCEQSVYNVKHWQLNRIEVIEEISNRFAPHAIAIRSSAVSEEQCKGSRLHIQ